MRAPEVKTKLLRRITPRSTIAADSCGQHSDSRGLPRPSYDRSLWALRTWLDSWSGIGQVVVGMARQGYDLQTHALRRARLARDLLHDRGGILADERDGHRMGAHALACDAAGGVGGAETDVSSAREHHFQ